VSVPHLQEVGDGAHPHVKRHGREAMTMSRPSLLFFPRGGGA
jgi:hypothetical protein